VHCPKCRSTAVKARPERTAQGYRRFRCVDCTKQFNERSGGLLNRTQYPSDVIALVGGSVGRPRAFSAAAISPVDVTPAAWICRTIGNTLGAGALNRWSA
jgi:transposase-like protein